LGSLCCVVQDEIERFMEVAEESVVDEELGALIKALWADAGIQEAFTNRHKFQLNDSAP
jgi:hypothetical protein